jgi:hypothetical protein
MVISPVVRGMFGLAWNAPSNTLSVTPHLPADWDDAVLRNVPLGASRLDLKFTRSASELIVEAVHAPADLHLVSQAPGAHSKGAALHLPLPPVEISIYHHLPQFGAETRQLKVLDQQADPHSLVLTLSGFGGETYNLLLRENAANLHVRAERGILGELNQGMRTVAVTFPPASQYVTRTIQFSW